MLSIATVANLTGPLHGASPGDPPVDVRAILDRDRFRREMIAWNAGADYLYHPPAETDAAGAGGPADA
jgi:hypothetical protein